MFTTAAHPAATHGGALHKTHRNAVMPKHPLMHKRQPRGRSKHTLQRFPSTEPLRRFHLEMRRQQRVHTAQPHKNADAANAHYADDTLLSYLPAMQATTHLGHAELQTLKTLLLASPNSRLLPWTATAGYATCILSCNPQPADAVADTIDDDDKNDSQPAVAYNVSVTSTSTRAHRWDAPSVPQLMHKFKLHIEELAGTRFQMCVLHYYANGEAASAFQSITPPTASIVHAQPGATQPASAALLPMQQTVFVPFGESREFHVRRMQDEINLMSMFPQDQSVMHLSGTPAATPPVVQPDGTQVQYTVSDWEISWPRRPRVRDPFVVATFHEAAAANVRG